MDADSATTLASYRTLLLSHADPLRAIGMAAYMKQHFTFLGIPTPRRRQLCKPLFVASKKAPLAQILQLAANLWAQPEREFHYTAIDLLQYHGKQLDASAWPLIASFITSHSWWDSVDAIASNLAGPLALADPAIRAEIDDWASDANLWRRRTAILYQLCYGPQTDAERLFAHCHTNAADSEFFIRKAIGWALRQYARIAPDAVRSFVHTHQAILSPLSQREALKHLAG